jgi:hypothetical protein
LTKNVTYALEAQVQTDDKMDVHINILEAAVITLGNELDTIKYQQGLLCHLDFHHVCDTMNQNFAGKQ